MLNEVSEFCYAEQVDEHVESGGIILDVRSEYEWRQGNMKNSINIPVDELRSRIGELDKRKKILVYCQVGQRAHVAVRILLQHGFRAMNLSGGYRTCIAYVNKKAKGELPVLSLK